MKIDKFDANSSAGRLDLLTLVFIILKLTHMINWSWWWVLSPLWISTSLDILVAFIAGIIIGIRGEGHSSSHGGA